MKRIISYVLALMLVLTMAPAAQAATSVSGAVKEYKSALSTQSKAKSAYTKAKAEYKKASVEYNKGSYGFFSWVASNKTGWEAEDAKEAMNIIKKTGFKKYTKLGKKNDATDLHSMKKCVDLLPTLVKVRKNDENFNVPEATFRHLYMARAQVNANASAVTKEHMDIDEDYPAGFGGECLEFGLEDPFVGWYTREKETYNKARKVFLKKYGKDINIYEENEYLMDTLGDTYDEIMPFNEVGHYRIVMFGNEPNDELPIFGLGCNIGLNNTFCLSANVDTYDNAYTVGQYKNLFNQYYNLVNPKAEKAARDAALSKYKTAISKSKTKLNKVRTAAKPTLKGATRKGKTVTAKWAKKSGAAKYEVSVTAKRSGTKVVKTVKGTSAKIKIKTAKRKYVKVRSVVKVNGKNVYSKWSKIKVTR